MGIKGLWTVLAPYSEKKSLHEIRGETVAVDLAGWVCDSQNVTEYYIQPKLYLRNLFFRTMYLLLADINPIFVLEGDAPELKRDVMVARNAIQFRGAAPKSNTVKSKGPNMSRKRFKSVLKECEILLKSMGVRCVRGQGEAEATCARLNAKGVAHAVVSQDSDAFAYGARRVYRNFSAAGTVDCYDADAALARTGFGRNKMVALALLCGCDYGAGACGVGAALAFLRGVREEDALDRLRRWAGEPRRYEALEAEAAAGRERGRRGCAAGGTGAGAGCVDAGDESSPALVRRELALRRRALAGGGPFPDPEILEEFLSDPPEDFGLDAAPAPAPDLLRFAKIMSEKLEWPARYCVEKFLPLLTRRLLRAPAPAPAPSLRPARVVRRRTPRGVPSYEVVWEDAEGLYDGLVPDDQLEEGEDASAPWTTVERQDLVRERCPELVERYEEERRAGAAGRGRAKRRRERGLARSLRRLSVAADARDGGAGDVSVRVNDLKRKRKRARAGARGAGGAGGDGGDGDLSALVERIVARRAPAAAATLLRRRVRLRFADALAPRCSTPKRGSAPQRFCEEPADGSPPRFSPCS